MSYLVLARRLRPGRFEDLVGQEINSNILRNAVITNKVAHAFLFSGSRGVGKTSAARILTRAVNCLKQENGNPCNKCENCVDINNNASPDIFEIDAASNRGIDNIRELRENVNYVPSRCRFKVYIIDEAHMLTLESFNALLKTLEEPPQFVKFILATTDPHKIPKTIISRCQRYDFLRISVKEISDYLEKIIKDEDLEISRKSLEMIAQNSSGGMRDALTSLDQILSIQEGNVSERKVAEILGILDQESRVSFIEALLTKKDEQALQHFKKLQERGYDANDILSDLLNTIKTISLVHSFGIKPTLFQDISSDDLQLYQKLAKEMKINELQQIFQILLQLEERLKLSSHAKICFEMAILQITSVQSLVGIEEIIGEIKNLNSLESSEKKKFDNTIKLASETKAKNKFQENQKNFNLHIPENINGTAEINSNENNLESKKKFGFEEEEEKSINEKTFEKDNEEIKSLQDQKKFFKKFNQEENYKGIDDSSEKYNYNQSIKKNKKKSYESIEKSSELSSLELDKEKNFDREEYLISNEKPSDEWYNFAEEAQKISPKLASFVRNAIPQSLSDSKINLFFKSSNFSYLLDKSSLEILEKIASELSGHSIQILKNISESISSKKTIAEYQKIVDYEEKKTKRKNAIESPQVKSILSVFSNSKIAAIKLQDE